MNTEKLVSAKVINLSSESSAFWPDALHNAWILGDRNWSIYSKEIVPLFWELHIPELASEPRRTRSRKGGKPRI